MKKTLITIGTILLIIIITIAIIFSIYVYRNLNWYNKNERNIKKSGVVEKQINLPSGGIINYCEIENNKPALLLIHGQGVAWEDYANLLPELSKNWHIYAIDLYGHGESSHQKELYYLDKNGNDLIWFIDNIIEEKTVIAGHSNGAILAAYIGAYGGSNIKALILEDPPIFSTEGENWENTFAYLDTYKPLHEYINGKKEESWEAYYLRNSYWGQLFMPDSIDKIADYAQKYKEKHMNEEVKIFYLPPSMTTLFHYSMNYDLEYGELFYNLSWNNGYSHKEILENIEVPCIYLHGKEEIAKTGVYLCAATKEQAERAVAYIGENCEFIEMEDSNHAIHNVHTKTYLEAVNSMLKYY